MSEEKNLKQTWADLLSEKTGCTKKLAAELVDNQLSTLVGRLVSDKEVAIHGFGKFKIEHKEARIGRNPQSGEKIKIPARNAVKFTPASLLRDAANQ
jgi:nucleoid DNA-binding protein